MINTVAKRVKVYWINLDERDDRAIFMQDQLQEHGYRDTTRIRAIPHEEVDALSHPDDLERDGMGYLCDPSKKWFPKCVCCKLERAALISHMKAIEKGYEDGDEWFLVLEDDVVIAHRINYGAIIKNMPQGAEILQLTVTHPKVLNKYFNVFNQEKPQYFARWAYLRTSASAYLCSRAGAKKAIDLFKVGEQYRFHDNPALRLADVMLFKTLNTFVLTYPLFYPNVQLGSDVNQIQLINHACAVGLIKDIIAKTNKHPFARAIAIAQK